MAGERTQQRQINIRLDDETLARIDECRSLGLKEQGVIPTRSDIVRVALEAYLESCLNKPHPPK
ncbi:MAG: CopG family transcriptional regulator [Halothiobacillaceae bacterium]|nr:MAG: CopG family transcriptional regulator [Halothiobacillaceae bacterium]